MTPARSDRPKVGDEIAVVHCCGQWYGGPMTVTAVEPGRIVARRPIFTRMADPDHIPHLIDAELVFGGEWDFRWNLVADLTPEEREPMVAFSERVAQWRAKYEVAKPNP
jgi:hypothetical protein